MRVYLTDEQIDSMLEEYRGGASATAIAASMGINTGTVYNHIKRAGAQLHQPQFSSTASEGRRPRSTRKAPQRSKTPYGITDGPVNIDPAVARSAALTVCDHFADDVQTAWLVLDVLGLDRPDLVAKAPLAYVVTEHIRHRRPIPRARRIA